MDVYSKFNRGKIEDRQVDTLIGLSKGLIADGIVNQAEAEFLHTWLVQSRQSSNNPIIINLLEKIDVMLSDGVLDSDESQELLAILRKLSGEESEFGELAKTSSLPIDEPAPKVIYEGHTFLFTGTCAYGTRKECQLATEKIGGLLAKSVTKSLNYLVLGTYVSESWIHENFGRKIEKAMGYRDGGLPLAIITEEHWASSGGVIK